MQFKNFFTFCILLSFAVSCKKDPSIKPQSKEWDWCGDTIACWGDSHIANGVPWMLSTGLGQFVYNMGIGGQTSVEITERFLNDPTKHKYPTVIWMGGNNNWDSAQVSADIDTVVKRLKHGKYIVLGMLIMDNEVAWKGDSTQVWGGMLNHIIVKQNQSRAKDHGKHFIDILSILQKHADGSAADSMSLVHNVVPKHLLSDPVHLNPKGEQIVVKTIMDLLNECPNSKN